MACILWCVFNYGRAFPPAEEGFSTTEPCVGLYGIYKGPQEKTYELSEGAASGVVTV